MGDRKYFGTDGIRGRVGEFPISADFMLRLGAAAGRVLVGEGRDSATVVIGKDTRISGYMFESALEAGLVAAGIDVVLAHQSRKRGSVGLPVIGAKVVGAGTIDLSSTGGSVTSTNSFAVVADNGVVIHYVANNTGAKFKTVADASFTPEQYGIAVKKGNAELLEKINKGLADIKADGTYDQIFNKYFGTK